MRRISDYPRIDSAKPSGISQQAPVPVSSMFPALPSVFFFPNAASVQYLLEQLEDVRGTLDVAIYDFHYAPLTTLLVRLHQRGCRIRILVDAGQAQTHDTVALTELVRVGIQVGRLYHEQRLHHKFAILDAADPQRARYCTGSLNWTWNGFHRNAENLLWGTESKICRDYQRAFDEHWRQMVALNIDRSSTYSWK